MVIECLKMDAIGMLVDLGDEGYIGRFAQLPDENQVFTPNFQAVAFFDLRRLIAGTECKNKVWRLGPRDLEFDVGLLGDRDSFFDRGVALIRDQAASFFAPLI